MFCMRRLCMGSEGSRLRSGNSPGLRGGEAVRDRLESEWVLRLRSEMGGAAPWARSPRLDSAGSRLGSGTVSGIGKPFLGPEECDWACGGGWGG